MEFQNENSKQCSLFLDLKVTISLVTPLDLFALDMTAPASLYVSSLRYHVVLRRLSVSDLRSLRSGTTLQTLLPKQEVTINKESLPESDVITVDGVGVVFSSQHCRSWIERNS
ncbi:hypothetical protein AQUCO_00400021v1 [Aquilegia coerulea]|uniref:Uncharacterized protein n=1 Tax=Aquilegia coerulea TaxID=218851 RepID=A0A2G5ESZ9_AQUCA|nr:hypothetical protein AQUCO_01100063v1 [Aquilegia coerulea]PIA58876.1 hypothetical protein AQUCO_00400021v1 [Aquilegia coerulea]